MKNQSQYYIKYFIKLSDLIIPTQKLLVGKQNFNLIFAITVISSFQAFCMENSCSNFQEVNGVFRNYLTQEDSSIKKYNTNYTYKKQDNERVSRKEVIDYLYKLNLIKDINNYTLKLTNNNLYIDGKKQRDKIHNYILENFVKEPEKHLEVTYTVKTN